MRTGTYLRVAWRSVLKNKRRSLLTLSIVAVGTALTVFFWAMEEGGQDAIIKNATGLFSGQIQVEAQGFSDDYDVRKTISEPGPLLAQLGRNPEVVAYAPRVMAVGMARSASGSLNALLVGVDPEAEASVSRIRQSITEGEFLAPGDKKGVLVGKEMAENLGLSVGDKLVVMAQDQGGNIGAEALRVRGIFHMGFRELDNGMAVMTGEAARELLGVSGYHQIAIRIKHPRRADKVARALNPGPKNTVQSWYDFMPELVQGMAMDMGSIEIMLLIFIVMAVVGIANTTLMSVQEKVREFGMLAALGTRPGGIFTVVLLEALVICAGGLILGLALGTLANGILGITGIDLGPAMSGIAEEFGMGLSTVIYPTMGPLFWSHFHEPIIGFLLASVLSALWPGYIAARLDPAQALRFT